MRAKNYIMWLKFKIKTKTNKVIAITLKVDILARKSDSFLFNKMSVIAPKMNKPMKILIIPIEYTFLTKS